MRRSLVLTDEAAGHPFRASLPPHVRSGNDPQPVRNRWEIAPGDARRFFTAYCASLVVITILIA